MDKHALWKWLLLLGLTVISVALIWPPEKQIPLGLDIQGGISFTLAVDPDKVLQSMSEDLENKGIAEDALKARVPAEVRAAREEAVEIIRNRVDRWVWPGGDLSGAKTGSWSRFPAWARRTRTARCG